MRAIDGQRSDNRPTKRSPEEKKRQLALLEDRLKNLPDRSQPAVRQALVTQIAQLKKETSGR